MEAYGPVFLGDPEFWRDLCGRPLGFAAERYGFVPPCVGCHLYLHAVRIPLALKYGARAVVSGERESHDGRIKWNQVPSVLDLYRDFAAEFGIELLLPLRHVASGKEVEEILRFPWPEGGEQMGCVLSGNYLDEEGRTLGLSEEAILRYLRHYALPRARRFVVEGIHESQQA